ncbi:MAG: MarR family transcriptional regulator, partial [Pseudomonadota bacterium]
MADVDKTRADFIEKVGQIAQGEGLPKIAGRVFGLLMFDGAPVSFGRLAEELQVSRGSVSSSVRLLEDRGLIKRIGLAGERQDFFQMADQPYTGLLEGALKRIQRAEQEIEATVS